MAFVDPKSLASQLRLAVAACSLCLMHTSCEDPEAQDSAGPASTGGGTRDSGGGDSDAKAVAADCDGALKANAQWVAFEDAVLERVNEVRAKGADCGWRGSFKPAPPLVANAKLRCAARLHSLDMVKRSFFAHRNPDGESPMQRMKKSGYDGRYAGENIAAGQATAQAVMAGWMKSDGHCANIMNSRYKELGVGYVQDDSTKYTHYWTQNFGAK